MKNLSSTQLDRYYCSIFLKEIGIEGQKKLFNSKVLVVGVGGLGSHVLPILVSSGVGTIGILDNDKVSFNNLPRQTLYGDSDVNKFKVTVASKKMKKLNKDVNIISHRLYLNKRNAKRIFKDYDIVIDCTDNFDTKFVINDACVSLKIPFVSAGVSDYRGQVLTCIPNKSHDFKSLFDTLPPHLEKDPGVYPVAVSIIGNLATNEAVKYLLGIGELLTDTLLVVDTLHNHYQKILIK